MSNKTKFRVTEHLLDDRKQQHMLIDMFWQTGLMSRQEVYHIIATALSKEATVHISDLDEQQLITVAKEFEELQSRFAFCSGCKHADGVTSIGLRRCSLTGKPFCYRYEQSSDCQYANKPLTQCEDYDGRIEIVLP